MAPRKNSSNDPPARKPRTRSPEITAGPSESRRPPGFNNNIYDPYPPIPRTPGAYPREPKIEEPPPIWLSDYNDSDSALLRQTLLSLLEANKATQAELARLNDQVRDLKLNKPHDSPKGKSIQSPSHTRAEKSEPPRIPLFTKVPNLASKLSDGKGLKPRMWKSRLLEKLDTYAECFTSARQQHGYVFDQTEGLARDFLAPLVETADPGQDVNELIDDVVNFLLSGIAESSSKTSAHK
ncbi:hypothetical protein K3495_g15694 [Podosphaera aphanis]|nr:hypothetical protein K3495_g15694 [Podosphaera aphanis]